MIRGEAAKQKPKIVAIVAPINLRINVNLLF